MVWVKDDGSPTKYGRRVLSWNELMMLWDVPILFSALFGRSEEDLSVLERLLDSPPAKFLELGTDMLLTGCFRGGWRMNKEVDAVKETAVTEHTSAMDTLQEKVPDFRSHLTTGDGWLSLDRRPAAEHVVSPTATPMDKADFIS